MKKSILAVSVAAALGLAAGAASAATVKANGIGVINVIPYYSVQGNNVTQLSITNTDTTNGKAVKVRFRGAVWSDDIFDFTVFMSPGDVFTGAVTNNNGVAHFETADGTCTIGNGANKVNSDFPTFRLTGGENAATGTLEGYIEIINMADIPSSGTKAKTTAALGTSAAAGYSLYSAIKHVSGVAPCKSVPAAIAAIEGLRQDNVWKSFVNTENDKSAAAEGDGNDSVTGQHVNWLATPTTGLTSWVRVIDIQNVKAFGVPATAVDVTAAGKFYFTQSNIEVPPAKIRPGMTSDRIFFAPGLAAAAADGKGLGTLAVADGDGAASATTTTTTRMTTAYQFDFPDLSTDYEGAANAITARNNLTALIAKSVVMSEFSTLSSVGAATDIVLSQPTRRYYYNYIPCKVSTAVGVSNADTCGSVASPVMGTNYSRAVGAATSYFVVRGDTTTAYQGLDILNRVGLGNLTSPASPAVFFDREENSVATNASLVISPNPPSAGYTLSLKGEVAVVSLNRGAAATESGTLGGKLTLTGIDIVGGYETGWAILSTTDKVSGLSLPIIGFSALNVKGAQNYGTTLPLRYLTPAI